VHLRKDHGQAKKTVANKAQSLGRFFDFLVSRYQGDVHALTGCVLVQPIDEFNRPARADYGAARAPPSEEEIETLFDAWRRALPHARKYLPAARDYVAASLRRRARLRIARPSCSISGTGVRTWANTASFTCASARAAAAVARGPGWSQ
jgi:hypothetical protein